MKLSNEKIVNSIGSLHTLSNESLPVRASFYISKNVKELQKSLETYDEEKKKLMKKYCKLKEDGSLDVKKDGTVDIIDTENWNKDMKELMALETDVNIAKLNINDFGNATLTANEIGLIDFMIAE